MADLDRIKETIRRMIAKANDEGASEAEANSAFAVADRMMNKHGITLSDIESARASDFEERTIRTDRLRSHEADLICLGAIERFCDVRCWLNRCEIEGKPQWAIKFFGYRPDVELADWARSTIIAASEAEWRSFKTSPHYIKGQGRRQRGDFIKGMALRMTERLDQLTEERKKARSETGEGNALIVAKDAAVSAAYDGLNLSLGNRGGFLGPRHSAATLAGIDAGEKVGFDRPVERASGPLLIGQ